MTKIISETAIERRIYWVNEIKKLSGNFADDFERLQGELSEEVKQSGIDSLIQHLRLCGSIPERYHHDSSEEKLYSKYTDCLLSLSFSEMGFKSLVLDERADAADVEVYGEKYDFVADAKAFRLSRTAKNQKDFKVDAMHGWKRGKSNAMVVCPIYQLPGSSSQIYQSAISRDVCVFTYSHLSLLLCFRATSGEENTKELIHQIFKTIPTLTPSKNANDYWQPINRTILDFSKEMKELWTNEKLASLESIDIAKDEALHFLSEERSRIMRLSHDEAIKELIKINKIESKIKTINSISDNGLFTIK